MLSFDLEQLIINVGYVGLFAIVFAESGLFFGFTTTITSTVSILFSKTAAASWPGGAAAPQHIAAFKRKNTRAAIKTKCLSFIS